MVHFAKIIYLEYDVFKLFEEYACGSLSRYPEWGGFEESEDNFFTDDALAAAIWRTPKYFLKVRW